MSTRNQASMWYVLAVLAVLIAGITYAGFFMVAHYASRTLTPETPHDKYLLEVFKALLQVGTVLLLGSMVKLLLDDFTTRRQNADKAAELIRVKLEEKTGFRKDILRSLTHSFTKVKGIHRILATKGVTRIGSERMVQKDIYDEQMRALSQAELTLEIVWYDMINAHKLFNKPSFAFSTEVSASEKAHKAQEDLATLVKKSCDGEPQVHCIVEIMKDYLRNILGIYESQYPAFLENSHLPLSGFVSTVAGRKVSLEDFLDDGSDWDTRFVAAYRLASSAIRKDIISPEGML